MTLEEKHKAILAELLAGMKAIRESKDLREAKVYANVGIVTAEIIAREGRVPTEEESIALVERHSW